MEEASDVCCGLTFYLAIAVATVILYLAYKHMTDTENWEKYGVKQGSLSVRSISQLREGFGKLLAENGDTVGIKSIQMMLVTKDLSILKEVFVKDFSNFIDRPRGPATLSHVEKSLIFLKGQEWRRVRQIITPAYSTGKLKNIYKIIDERAKKLAQVIEHCASKDLLVPIKHRAGQYTGEVIARSALGLDSHCQGSEDDEFIYHAKRFFKMQTKSINLVMLMFLVFPGLQYFLIKVLKLRFFDAFDPKADDFFTSILRKTIEERQQAMNKGQRVPSDLLQNFIHAKTAAHEEHSNEEEANEARQATIGLSSDVKLPKSMSEDELIGQSLIVISGGFETTSTALQLCCYMLAKHPDVQEKLFEEVDQVMQSESVTYEELSKLKYTEQVIQETLRLYPPTSIISRQAAETRTYGTVTIPKGAAIIIPLFAILKDPKYYPDPEKFDPERFSDENKAKRDPMTFIPFGFGPHQCIGMRFALLEIKTALAYIVRKVKFELNERTEPKPGQEPTFRDMGILIPERQFMLSVTLRS